MRIKRTLLLANKCKRWKIRRLVPILRTIIMAKSKEVGSQAKRRALAVLARMRNRGESLSEAARHEHTTPRTVRKAVPKQLKRGPSGHYSVTPADTLRRDLSVFGFDGYVSVVVRSSKQAQLASEHLIAVNRFLRTGDTEWLRPFIGKQVGGVELLTDPDRLHELAEAGLIKLDALYRQNRGARQEK